jgi:hypothetical protein
MNHISYPTLSSLVMAAADALYIDCSTGAPAWANTSAAMKPFNAVKLAGTPGAPVTVSLDGSGVFNINGYKTWSGNLDRSGALELQVFSLQTGLVSLSAYVTNNPAISASGSMTFNNYTAGANVLTHYAIVTSAAADGTMRNSVYITTDITPGVDYARFQITNSTTARFVGTQLPQTANVLLYDDGTASIDLINSVAESVTLTISLPQASGSTVIDSCVFVTFPPLENLR